MWMLLPALSLAVVQIAGDNAGVVPDAAARAGTGIYLVVVLAYLVLGSGLTGLAAWIGVRTGTELAIVVGRLFGTGGKKVFAVITLGVSVPASALTGGYFAGWLVHSQTGLPHMAAAALCLAFFTLLAAGFWQELLVAANYCSLLLMPAIVCLLAVSAGHAPPPSPSPPVDWPLVLALFGYNAGGMRPALAAETAACLAKRGGRAVALTVAAKLVEGALTLAMAYIVIAAGTAGPLALAAAAENGFWPFGGGVFAAILFCTFATTMVPAMVVNGRHLACCTGLSSRPAAVLAGIAVYLTTFLAYDTALMIMAATAVATTAFIAYTAFVVHKMRGKQQ